MSRVVTQVRPDRFWAVDQDANSLAEVERCFGSLRVCLDRRNIRDIVSGQVTYDRLGLAYAAGLYDYLTAEAAQALTLRLFNMLAPGGTLLIANFSDGYPGRRLHGGGNGLVAYLPGRETHADTLVRYHSSPGLF